MHRISIADQCKGTTRRGQRCSLTSTKPFLDVDGKDVTLPLKLGCGYCLMHLPMLVATPRRVTDALMFYMDFETSGLDVLNDHIVEIGLLSEKGHCFSTVVRPPELKPGPHVHGIDNHELCQGPSFREAFIRMVDFVQHLQVIDMQASESSEDELPTARFAHPIPEVVLIAHNGRKFDFPFLFSECHRNELAWDDVVNWVFVDSLEIAKAVDAEVYRGCPKLQCLLMALASDEVSLKAHRALDCCCTKFCSCSV